MDRFSEYSYCGCVLEREEGRRDREWDGERQRERGGGAAKLPLGSSIDIFSYNYDSRISFVEMKNTIPQKLEKGTGIMKAMPDLEEQ